MVGQQVVVSIKTSHRHWDADKRLQQVVVILLAGNLVIRQGQNRLRQHASALLVILQKEAGIRSLVGVRQLQEQVFQKVGGNLDREVIKRRQ